MKCTLAACLIAAFSSLVLDPPRLAAVEPPAQPAAVNPPDSSASESAAAEPSAANASAASPQSPTDSEPAVDDSAVADALATSAKQPASDEAVIDMAKLYKGYQGFVRRHAALKDKVTEFEAEIENRRAEIDKLTAEVNASTDPESKQRHERDLTEKLTAARAYMTRARIECLQAEARMYNEVYDEICAEVARYAGEHGLRVVRRAATAIGPAQPVNPADRNAVLERVRRDVVYVAHRPAADITDQILERLNRDETKPSLPPAE